MIKARGRRPKTVIASTFTNAMAKGGARKRGKKSGRRR